MKFCSECGKELPVNSKGTCPSCGAEFSTLSRAKSEIRVIQQIPHKSPGTAALIAFFGAIFGLPGIGHIYVGRVGRGIAILLSGFTLYIMSFIVFFGSVLGGALAGARAGLSFVQIGGSLAMVLVLAYLGLLIWQIFNARSCAKKHNDQAAMIARDLE